MSPSADVLTLMRSVAFQEAARQAVTRTPSPFVTISRQRGAGGGDLAQALLARFERERYKLFSGWKIYDRALCEEVAADPKLSVFFESLLKEDFRGGMADLMAQFIAHEAPQSVIMRRTLEAARAAAAIGKAVIVGRAGNLATRGLPLGVHVRLIGSPRAREARLMSRGLSREQAQTELREADAARARLVREWFGKDIDDPLLYDAVFNTDRLSPADIAGQIVELVELRRPRSEAPAAPYNDSGGI